MVAGSTSETEMIESHRFSFLVYGAMACHGPGAYQRYADTWLTANARTQCPPHKADVLKASPDFRFRGQCGHRLVTLHALLQAGA